MCVRDMPSEPLEVETFNVMLNYRKPLRAIMLILLGVLSVDHKNKQKKQTTKACSKKGFCFSD